MSLNGYEILYILSTDHNEEKRATISDKLKEIITKNKGVILNEKEIGLQDFANVLKKKTQGYYYQVQFKISPDGLKTFQDQLVISEDVFRYQIIKLESILTKTELEKVINS